MTFTKPKDITYTQMAQWVDANALNPESSEELLCQYVYHLAYINAQKNLFFKDPEQLDDFAIYVVSRMVNRFRRGAQTTPVKSVVNYFNSVLSLWKADYIRDFCTGSADIEIANFNVDDFSDYLVDAASQYDYNAYVFNTKDIINAAYKTVAKIPHRKNSAEWDNIYISCLLTLEQRIMKAVRLCEKKSLQHDPRTTDMLIRSFKVEKPLLYHLPEHFATYINVLVNECVHAIAAELSYVTASKISVGACLRNMVIAAAEAEEE